MEMDTDSLLCDEAWPSSPDALNSYSSSMQMQPKSNSLEDSFSRCSFFVTEEEFEFVYAACLGNEQSYMPQPGYLEFLHHHHHHHHHLVFARHRAMEWLIQARSRLNLSLRTVFCAANYFDRFFSMHQCNGWKHWMIELLSVACLSVASKFNETTSFTFHDIQTEDLEHSFESSAIQRTELMLLSALGWRVNSTTAHSYVELLLNFNSLKPHVHRELTDYITDLLLETLSDTQLLEFRPCCIAISALKCSIEKILPSSSTADAHLIYILKLLPEDQKDDMVKCEKILVELISAHVSNKASILGVGAVHPPPPPKYKHSASSSPVTVLSSSSSCSSTETEERFSFDDDSHIDLCDLFKIPASLIMTTELGSATKKRNK